MEIVTFMGLVVDLPAYLNHDQHSLQTDSGKYAELSLYGLRRPRLARAVANYTFLQDLKEIHDEKGTTVYLHFGASDNAQQPAFPAC